jgi:hypothetical protein
MGSSSHMHKLNTSWHKSKMPEDHPIRVLQVIEETSGHARTFARMFCVSGRFLDLSRRNARTFPLSGWPKFRPPPELWPKASGKFGLLGQASGQPEGLNNPAPNPP